MVRLTPKGVHFFKVFGVVATVIIVIIILAVVLSSKKKTPVPPSATCVNVPQIPVADVPGYTGTDFCTWSDYLYGGDGGYILQAPAASSPDGLTSVSTCIELCKNHPTCTAVNTFGSTESNPNTCYGYSADPSTFLANAYPNGPYPWTNYMSLIKVDQ